MSGKYNDPPMRNHLPLPVEAQLMARRESLRNGCERREESGPAT